MVADVAKNLIGHPHIAEIKSFNEKYSDIEKIKSGWDAEISAKEVAVNVIKDKLEKYKIAFNFVGLYQGFNDLACKKNTELNWALGFLIILAILSITPVAIEVYLLMFKSVEIIKYKDLLIYAIFPTLTLQLI